MNLKVDDGSSREPGTVYLKLTEVEPNHILLEAVYDYSSDISENEALFLPGGGLLTITEEGFVSLSPAVDPDLGFPLDHIGRLRLNPRSEALAAQDGRRLGLRVREIKA